MLDINRRTRRPSSCKLLFFMEIIQRYGQGLFVSIPCPLQIKSWICWHTKHRIMRVSLSIYPRVRSHNAIGVRSHLFDRVPVDALGIVLLLLLLSHRLRRIPNAFFVVSLLIIPRSSSPSSSFKALRSSPPMASKLLLRRFCYGWMTNNKTF